MDQGISLQKESHLGQVEKALADSIAENEQLKDRVAQLEALLVEAQLRQENLQHTVRRLLATEERTARSRRGQRFKSIKAKGKA